MKLGLSFANVAVGATPEGAVAFAGHAEALGVESLWTVEHVVVPAGYESIYPYSSTGKMSGGEDSPIPDPMVWLAFIGAHTSRIKLATGMMILPQRNPIVTAKEAATLDVLTHGRFILGAGIGWLKEEFDIIGVPFEERGARTEEYVAVMRALWEGDRPRFQGRFFSFDDARMWPKPVGGTIPVVIGGHSEHAARRAGRIGDGFFPGNRDLAEIAGLVRVMRESAEAAGRDPDAIELTAGGRPNAETLEKCQAMGISRLVTAALAIDPDGAVAALDGVAEAMRAAGAPLETAPA